MAKVTKTRATHVWTYVYAPEELFVEPTPVPEEPLKVSQDKSQPVQRITRKELKELPKELAPEKGNCSLCNVGYLKDNRLLRLGENLVHPECLFKFMNGKLDTPDNS